MLNYPMPRVEDVLEEAGPTKYNISTLDLGKGLLASANGRIVQGEDSLHNST